MLAIQPLLLRILRPAWIKLVGDDVCEQGLQDGFDTSGPVAQQGERAEGGAEVGFCGFGGVQGAEGAGGAAALAHGAAGGVVGGGEGGLWDRGGPQPFGFEFDGEFCWVPGAEVGD